MKVDPAALAAGVLAGDRTSLARAITLVESSRDDHQALAGALLAATMQAARSRHAGAIRVGVTGVPGVGKSTFLEQLGSTLLHAGHRVAVLAVDPSSQKTGGSILGDKTRMTALSAAAGAFVRPSPSGGSLGGVHRKTREAMLLCEAAGYDVVLVETVGVGQSETAVAEMVDTLVVLMLPGAGDELQGIKKGILEVADVLVVHKADGERLPLARTAARDLRAALRLFAAHEPDWTPKVLLASSVGAPDSNEGGVATVWETVLAHRAAREASGGLATRRAEQQVRWMWAMVDEAARAAVRGDATVRAMAPGLEDEVRAGQVPASVAARRLLAARFG
ncbi:MAG: ArgK protein [Pseudomonadota bacterium]